MTFSRSHPRSDPPDRPHPCRTLDGTSEVRKNGSRRMPGTSELRGREAFLTTRQRRPLPPVRRSDETRPTSLRRGLGRRQVEEVHRRAPRTPEVGECNRFSGTGHRTPNHEPPVPTHTGSSDPGGSTAPPPPPPVFGGYDGTVPPCAGVGRTSHPAPTSKAPSRPKDDSPRVSSPDTVRKVYPYRIQ